MRALNRLFRFILNLQGAVVVGSEIFREENAVQIEVRRRRNAEPRCCVCGSYLTGRITTKRSSWRHLDLIRCRTKIVADIREGRCSKCDGRRLERVPWASNRSRHTRQFERLVAGMVQDSNKSAIARAFRVDWRTVGRIITRVVGETLPKDRLKNLEIIGVDETSYKRGHRYVTVVMCLQTGRTVWIGKGKSADTLREFFEELGPKRAKRLKAVAMDMGEAYSKAVEEHAPQADIVIDRFHVVKLLLDAIDEVRRVECRALEADAKKALKGSRYALLRNPEHLSKRDKSRIAKVRSANRKLHRAYELRVSFEQLWEIEDEYEAYEFLQNWTESALRSRRPALQKLARTLRKHAEGILGFQRWSGLSNAMLEGNNNKIKLVIHKAFGFRSIEALMAMIYLNCSGLDLGLE